LKLYKKINVNQSKYSIFKAKGLLSANGIYGHCDRDKKVIVIDESLKGEDFNLTLLHEIRHAFQFEYGFSQILSPDTMELDAELSANFMNTVFQWKLK